MAAWDGWRLAVGTLTTLPVTRPSQVDATVARTAVWLAPLAVLPAAAIAAGLGWGAQRAGVPALGAGLIMVAALAWLTRAIHLDGLADTADGLGSGRPAEGALAIMRRGDIGPMGVVTLMLVLGLQAVCAGELLARPFGAGPVLVALCASRGALAVACRRSVPAARPDGLGAVFAASVPVGQGLLIGAALTAAVAGASLLAGLPWWQGVLAVAVAAATSWYVVRLAVRRLGGVTGDVLGASVEVAAAALLLVLAA